MRGVYRCTSCAAHFTGTRKQCTVCGTAGIETDRETCHSCGSSFSDSSVQRCPRCGSTDVERVDSDSP